MIYAGIIGALCGMNTKKISNKIKLLKISSFFQFISAILFILFYKTNFIIFIASILGLLIFFPMPCFVTIAYLRKDITPKKISITFSIFWSISYLVSIFIIQIFALIKENINENIAFLFLTIMESSFFIGTTFF